MVRQQKHWLRDSADGSLGLNYVLDDEFEVDIMEFGIEEATQATITDTIHEHIIAELFAIEQAHRRVLINYELDASAVAFASNTP